MNYSFGIFWSKLKGLLWVTDQVPSFPYICWVKVFIYLFICFLFICQKKIYSHTDTQYINGTPRMHELRACGAPYLSKSTHPRKFGNHVIVRRVTIHPHHRHTSVNIGVRGNFARGAVDHLPKKILASCPNFYKTVEQKRGPYDATT